MKTLTRILLIVLFAASAPVLAWAQEEAMPTANVPPGDGSETVVAVGSKTFTESVILAEILSGLARSTGAEVRHEKLGGTQVLFKALRQGSIDAYPEYTGTITQEIFHGRNIETTEEIREALGDLGIRMTEPLGFNNTYALGMKKEKAAELGIETISDLRDHPELAFGFSNEFMDRGDGWPALQARYRLPQEDVLGLDHDLAYRGLENDSIDVIDLYSTDAKIAYYDLKVLEDDLQHFPLYNAVILYRANLAERAPLVVERFQLLEGLIPEEKMVAMNARVELRDGEGNRESDAAVAADFLKTELGIRVDVEESGVYENIARWTLQHLWLVFISMSGAILLAVPLGILAFRVPAASQVILGVVGAIQTMPSLALLVFMIPLFGLGNWPAIAALFLYSLLPIVRNTYAGLQGISGPVRESAAALGLPAGARMRLVELPIAMRTILAGIKTSAVINVGTATLGALIGSGGYGQPILTGLRLDSLGLILQGAIPAALLAFAIQGFFELIERLIVSRGMRMKQTV